MLKKLRWCEEEVIIAVKEKSNLFEDNRGLFITINALNLLGFNKSSNFGTTTTTAPVATAKARPMQVDT